MIQGVAVLASCFLTGKVLGDILGRMLDIDSNVGGVGFSMVLLILVTQWLHKRKWFSLEMEAGILFWSNLYIPVIVAMSAVQNVRGALSGGMVAVLAGIIPTAVCVLLVPWLSRLSHPATENGLSAKQEKNHQ